MRWRAQTDQLRKIPVFYAPIVHAFAFRARPPLLEAIVGLRNRTNAKRYELVVPAEIRAITDRFNVDVRSVLVKTLLANPAYSSLFDRDRFDDLDVTSVTLLFAPTRATDNGSIAIAITEKDRVFGYPVESILRLPARRFTCAQCKVVLRHRSALFLAGFAKHAFRRNWTGYAVAIKAGRMSQTGIVTNESSREIGGITSFGTSFRLRRSAIRTISDAPDLVSINLNIPRAIIPGVLYINATGVAGTNSVKLLTQLKSSSGAAWVLSGASAPIHRNKEGTLLKFDLPEIALERGYSRLSSLRIMMLANARRLRPTATFSDALIVNSADGGSAAVPSRLQMCGSPLLAGKLDPPKACSISSSLGTGSVPNELTFSSGKSPTREVVRRYSTAPSDSMRFSDSTGNKWLVFSEQFDRGWQLQDDGGKSMGVHLRLYGTLNGWYVPTGLHGTYHIIYTAERYVRFALWIECIVMLILAAGSIALFCGRYRNTSAARREKLWSTPFS